MKEYDVIVADSMSGMNIVNEALAHDLKVVLGDKGPLKGTYFLVNPENFWRA